MNECWDSIGYLKGPDEVEMRLRFHPQIKVTRHSEGSMDFTYELLQERILGLEPRSRNTLETFKYGAAPHIKQVSCDWCEREVSSEFTYLVQTRNGRAYFFCHNWLVCDEAQAAGIQAARLKADEEMDLVTQANNLRRALRERPRIVFDLEDPRGKQVLEEFLKHESL